MVTTLGKREKKQQYSPLIESRGVVLHRLEFWTVLTPILTKLSRSLKQMAPCARNKLCAAATTDIHDLWRC